MPLVWVQLFLAKYHLIVDDTANPRGGRKIHGGQFLSFERGVPCRYRQVRCGIVHSAAIGNGVDQTSAQHVRQSRLIAVFVGVVIV